MEKIKFKTDNFDNEEIDFYVLEHTKVSGVDYILVTDSEAGEDGDALILKNIGAADDAESIFEIVADEIELNAVAAVFNSLLEDTVLEEK
ncbi:MAG: DUF1292 domain-containing protein [Lachnospiraceae bacterium]|nr:DUF1292 domain-containing protein [Lachnospiraceae bacterium]